jgi:hypothetical protein
MCSDIGIGMHFCLLLGFPSEKEHQREELIKFFKDNETSLMKMPFFATFNNFSLMPKSFIYENPGKFGIKKIKENSEDYNMCDVPYKTIFEDDTRSDQIKHILDVFKLKLMKIFAEDEGLYFSWFNIADSAYELLLNDYCSKTKINPFKTRTTI